MLALEDVGPTCPETLDQMIEMQFQQAQFFRARILRSASVAEAFLIWAISTSAEFESEASTMLVRDSPKSCNL